jgi:FtsZ-interacting cell division protein ZipA
MSTWVWIVIAIAVVVVLVAIAGSMAARRRKRSAALREGFGPEYDRTVERTGSRSDAEEDLLERKRMHDELQLRPLAPESQSAFRSQWRQTQAQFVDDPKAAIIDADRLIQQVMRERGYPVEDFEQRASLVSVDHPMVVERYRRAHGIAAADSSGTEDYRQAMQDYRALFEEMVEEARR